MSRGADRIVGVLGGMGPLATASFLRHLVEATPARSEQEHLRVLTWSDPSVPDRVGPILTGQGEDPEPALVAGARRLEAAGAGLIAMPCNTAHRWFPAIEAAVAIPVLHIVDAVRDALGELRPGASSGRVGLLATRATYAARIYEERLGADWRVVAPREATLTDALLPAIAGVKEGRLEWARARALDACTELAQEGVDAVVLGCTELGAVLEPSQDSALVPLIDSSAALAARCVVVARG